MKHKKSVKFYGKLSCLFDNYLKYNTRMLAFIYDIEKAAIFPQTSIAP